MQTIYEETHNHNAMPCIVSHYELRITVEIHKIILQFKIDKIQNLDNHASD